MADMAYREIQAMNSFEARKLLIRTCQETGSISKTACLWHTSRQVVRKWVRRFQEEGEEGLKNHSRRPHHSPRQTPPEIEHQIMKARQTTKYGRDRLALYLQRGELDISPHTIRHILRRHRDPTPKGRKRRKPLYPALWTWEVEEPFSLIQADVKNILDKQSLGPTLWDHLRKHHLPRYQWTACEGQTRIRFLAYSHYLNRTNGWAFLVLVLLWPRTHGITNPVTTSEKEWTNKPSLEVLCHLGYNGPDRIALLPPILLDKISTDLLLACGPEGGNDLFTCYIHSSAECICTTRAAIRHLMVLKRQIDEEPVL